MQQNIVSNQPRTILNGVHDESIVPLVSQPEVLPQHLPLFYLQTPQGSNDDSDMVVNESDFTRIFGTGAVDPRGPYYNHATVFCQDILGKGNACIIKRITRPTSLKVSNSTASPVLTLVNGDTTYLKVGMNVSQASVGGSNLFPVGAGNISGLPATTNGGTTPVMVTAINNIIVDSLTVTQITLNVNPIISSTAGAPATFVFNNVPKESNLVIMATLDTTAPIYQYARDGYGNVILNSVTGLPVYAVDNNGDKILIPGGISIKYSVVPQGTMSLQQLSSPQSTAYSTTCTTTFNSNTVTNLSSTSNLDIGMPITNANFQAGTTIIAIINGSTIQLSSAANTTANNSIINFAGNMVYPIAYFQAPQYGSYGNNYGIKLWTAGPNAPFPGDIDVINNQNSLIFNAQILQNVTSSTAQIVTSIFSESTVAFCFMPNAYNYKDDQDLSIQTLVKNWNDDGASTNSTPTYGPIGTIEIFENNLTSMLNVLLAAELANAPAPVNNINLDPTNSSIWMLDFLTGINVDGIYHYGFQVDTTGSMFTYNNAFFMMDGYDGDLSNYTFEQEIINQVLNNYQNANYPLINMALYPFSVIYDSGFSNPVKTTLLEWMGYRKNVKVSLGTHVVGQPQLTPAEEISADQYLLTSIQAYNESDVWGTPAYRATVMMQSGYIVNSTFTKPVSLLYELAMKRALYMGAGSGIMKSGLSYLVNPQNVITYMKNVSSPSLNDITEAAAWNAGATYAIPYSRRQLFWPLVQTVYANGAPLLETSILTDDITQAICCDIQLKSAQIWAQLTGSKLTDAQFIKRSNDLMTKMTTGIYDNQVTIVPNTYFTAADQARGYSWVMDVAVYGNNAKTVGQYNVVTRRQVTNTTTTTTG